MNNTNKKSKDSPIREGSTNLLQLKLLIFNVDLLDVVTESGLMSSNKSDKVVSLLQDFMEIYNTVSMLPKEKVNEVFTHEEVKEIEEKYLVISSRLTNDLYSFNSPTGEA